MPLLFSYGTLQQSEVQYATFGRMLAGKPDDLVGFVVGFVRIEDAAIATKIGRTHHANAVFTGDQRSRIRGMVFEISEAEMAAADEYESEAGYRRVLLALGSGTSAWVYVHASLPHEPSA